METDIVYRNESGVAVTTSYLVAETFGKEHRHVVRDIDLLFLKVQDVDYQCSPNLADAKNMFVEVVEDVPQPNGGTKEMKSYVMNRDGFTLLAMGYTGKKAMTFKLRYIAAFNSMEKQLKQGITQSIESLTRKQILQIALEAEEEKERLAARLALSEEKNREMAASIESILPRIEQLEQKMSAPKPQAQQQYIIPTTMRKKFAEDPKAVRRKHPEYKNGIELVEWLNKQGVAIKKVEFYAFLRENGFVSSNDTTYNMPTDESVRNGWMITVHSGTSQHTPGRHYYTPFFTPKGAEHFRSILRSVKKNIENNLFKNEHYEDK